MTRDSYAPGFWCATAALGLLAGTYFYGVVQEHRLEQTLTFLHSALAVLAVIALGVLAWTSYETLQWHKRQEHLAHTRVLIWDAKVALRKVETVFDRYFWGSYWQPGRSFQEVMGDLEGTPLQRSLLVLTSQCQVLDEDIHAGDWRWLSDARDLSTVATRLARQRYLLDFCDPRNGSNAQAAFDQELESLVYSWSSRLREFEQQLDELEQEYC